MQLSCSNAWRQEQQLALGVERAALHALSIPRRADLDAPIDRIDVHERGHAHGLPGESFNDGKGNHRTLLLQIQAPVDFRLHSIGRGNAGVPQLPKLAVLHGLDHIVVVRVAQRYQ